MGRLGPVAFTVSDRASQLSAWECRWLLPGLLWYSDIYKVHLGPVFFIFPPLFSLQVIQIFNVCLSYLWARLWILRQISLKWCKRKHGLMAPLKVDAYCHCHDINLYLQNGIFKKKRKTFFVWSGSYFKEIRFRAILDGFYGSIHHEIFTQSKGQLVFSI